MTGNQGRPSRRQLTFNDMQVRATNAADADTQQHFVGGRFGIGQVSDLKRPVIHRLGGFQEASFHLDLGLRAFSLSLWKRESYPNHAISPFGEEMIRNEIQAFISPSSFS